jgi:pimeloyl-ACP methyl ester carboxylesterase
MAQTVVRETLTFLSHGTRCLASLYLPDDSRPLPCLVMGHGFTGTQDQLEPYARRFAQAGIAVLTFDYRYFGLSEGQPRQLVDCSRQEEDWRAAVELARSLDPVDPQKIGLWGSSLSGGHVVRLAADDPSIAAVVVQVPVFDKSTRGMAREAREKMAREGISLGSLLWVTLRSVAAGGYDALRGAVGLSPSYMQVFDAPGRVAAFTDPDSAEHRALFERAGASWRNEFTPRFLFRTPKYVKGTSERLRMPLLVCVAEHDTDANPQKAIDVARRAPHGELASYPVRHFDIYTGDAREQVLRDQIDFLSRALRSGSAPVR